MSETLYGSLTNEIMSLTRDLYRIRKLKNISGQVVLITGGGGGVGYNLAKNFAKLNARVVIWDVNKEAVKSAIDRLQTENFCCTGYVIDITNRQEVYEIAKKVKEDVGSVDILINNAGIVTCKPFWDLPEPVIENTYAVNILSHYWTIKAFLPDMMKINRGHIVTVGSVAGMIGTYGCTDYSATKFACAGLHESLFTELKTHGYDINLTLVCPYYIATGMFTGVKPRLLPMLEPMYVANRITMAIQKNEILCTLPNTVRILLPLKCLLPAKMCWELMARVMKGPDSMMMFKGRGRVAAG